ncbi:hypothetical protein PUN28_017342 [Cardiocondyla obscurior]|uniref:Uncharacterized protein n=1 Tax=Cardiocondyla obscurior TaxID=286306 RepID=A0AAW2ENI3_9HYME
MYFSEGLMLVKVETRHNGDTRIPRKNLSASLSACGDTDEKIRKRGGWVRRKEIGRAQAGALIVEARAVISRAAESLLALLSLPRHLRVFFRSMPAKFSWQVSCLGIPAGCPVRTRPQESGIIPTPTSLLSFRSYIVCIWFLFLIECAWYSLCLSLFSSEPFGLFLSRAHSIPRTKSLILTRNIPSRVSIDY